MNPNITKIAENHYNVKSDRTNETYFVDVGHSRCTCMDFTRKGFVDYSYKCKHIKMVELETKSENGTS